jgi:hypothetical protein
MQVLKKHNLDKDDKIDRTELTNAFKDVSTLFHQKRYGYK